MCWVGQARKTVQDGWQMHLLQYDVRVHNEVMRRGGGELGSVLVTLWVKRRPTVDVVPEIVLPDDF